jgi:hypothetical protein
VSLGGAHPEFARAYHVILYIPPQRPKQPVDLELKMDPAPEIKGVGCPSGLAILRLWSGYPSTLAYYLSTPACHPSASACTPLTLTYTLLTLASFNYILQ